MGFILELQLCLNCALQTIHAKPIFPYQRNPKPSQCQSRSSDHKKWCKIQLCKIQVTTSTGPYLPDCRKSAFCRKSMVLAVKFPVSKLMHWSHATFWIVYQYTTVHQILGWLPISPAFSKRTQVGLCENRDTQEIQCFKAHSLHWGKLWTSKIPRFQRPNPSSLNHTTKNPWLNWWDFCSSRFFIEAMPPPSWWGVNWQTPWVPSGFWLGAWVVGPWPLHWRPWRLPVVRGPCWQRAWRWDWEKAGFGCDRQWRVLVCVYIVDYCSRYAHWRLDMRCRYRYQMLDVHTYTIIYVHMHWCTTSIFIWSH